VTPTELRQAVATALSGLDPDWTVWPSPVDSLQPPGFILVWGDPWLVPVAMCNDTAQLEVVAVAARMEPEANYETLEALVSAANVALEAAGYRPAQVNRPGPFDVAKVTYLAARIIIRRPVEL
jgi:hypothetical protein